MAKDSAKTARIQRGRPFKKGQSGNPRGRPQGSRNNATLACEALLDGEAERLTRKAIERALDGDSTALRLCIERLIPPRRERVVPLELPEVETAADAVRAKTAILAALSAGTLSPGEAEHVSRVVDGFVNTLEAAEFEQRLAQIERQVEQGGR